MDLITYFRPVLDQISDTIFFSYCIGNAKDTEAKYLEELFDNYITEKIILLIYADDEKII